MRKEDNSLYYYLAKMNAKSLIAKLIPRDQSVLSFRFGLTGGRAHTLEETGREFDITRERVRQIEAKALEKMEIKDKSKSKYWVAFYQPAGHAHRTKLFKTKKQAEKYVISQCCVICKEEGLDSSCAAEWLIIRYDKYLKADNHFELMEAAGWKRIK
jgi:hypothetical protein